jgi:hypothetical protein
MDAFERATEECEDAMSVFERDDLLLLSAAKKIIEGRAYDWTSDDRQTIARMRALAQDLGATVSERNYGCPLRAKSGLMQCSKKKSYSITSSTRPISVSGC